MGKISHNSSAEKIVQSELDTTPDKKHVGNWVLAATILGSGMALIDSTAMNVVLPVLQLEFSISITTVQWIIEAYALFLASLMLLGGSLGDHFGRRRIFASGIVLFTVASVFCGIATDATHLIIARIFQGIGGALLVPASLAIINVSFKIEHRGRAIGAWSGFTAITTALGPVLGGWLVDNISWRSVFFINVPIAIIVLCILFFGVPESRNKEGSGKLDLWGALLVTTGLGGIVFGLVESSGRGFNHPLVLGSLIFGFLVLIAFIIFEGYVSTPMMPLNLFHSRNFSGANIVTFLLYGAFGGSLFFIPFNLIQVQGYSAASAGAAFLPSILIISLFSRQVGGMVGRYGAKIPLVVGPTIVALGYLMFAIPGIGGSYWSTFFPAVVALGFGMAITIAPLTTTVMNAVEEDHSGLASGINNSTARIAGLLSIAVLGIIILHAFNSSLDNHLASLQLPPETRQIIDEQRIKLAAIELPYNISSELRDGLKKSIAESFVASFRIIMFITSGLALVSALMAWLTIEGTGTRPKLVAKDSKITRLDQV
ncbi:MAG: MFS transporter [Deltaproteobacteria bacterium]|nr:MFS transporter [Deltaproteobacteria bacterium]